MLNKISLYHGSDVIVSSPNLYIGKPRHDFGRAFYLTTSEEQAIKWSKYKFRKGIASSPKIKYNFLVSKFSVDDKKLANLSVKIFDKPNEDWLNYVVNKRKSSRYAVERDYDLVIGPLIDGRKSWITLALYSKGKLSFKDTVERIKPESLKDQWAFKTQKAINILSYEGVINERR